MYDIPGVNDHVRRRIKTIYGNDRAFEIRDPLIGVGRTELYVGVGNLRNDHNAGRIRYRRLA